MSFAAAQLQAIAIAVVPAQAHLRSATAPIDAAEQCSNCRLRGLCLPRDMSDDDIQSLRGMVFASRRVKAQEPLYQAGEGFHAIYAVRSGTLKSSLMLADGREQVSGFHLAGELIGLDGIANGKHASTVTALEDTDVCVIPYGNVQEMGMSNARMQLALGRLMSREIVREHSLMLLLGSMNAEERLGTFLLNLSQRLKARGYSATEFHLRMSRAELGSYLGLQLETVSRTLSAFKQQRLLEVDKKHIRLTDLDGIARMFPGAVH